MWYFVSLFSVNTTFRVFQELAGSRGCVFMKLYRPFGFVSRIAGFLNDWLLNF